MKISKCFLNGYHDHFICLQPNSTKYFQSVLLSYSRDGRGGATIGKRLMGIKVVKAQSVVHLPATNQVVVKPGTDIGFWR